MSNMPSQDNKIQEMIQEVEKREAEIAVIERPHWKTNKTFSFVEGDKNQSFNIGVITNIKELILMASHLLVTQEAYMLAAKAIGVENTPNFTWGGFSVSDWIDDLSLRVNQIGIASKKAKLETLKKRLDAIISPEMRREMELKAIERELG